MTDHPSTANQLHNRPVFTVSELSLALKREVETTFDDVAVRGEVSGFKKAASGHLYFALKDVDAVLDAVCWRGVASALSIAPKDGMEVVAVGRLTTFPSRSRYQIVVERLELAGQGALLKLLEDRRQALAKEGLFDPERKRPLPFLPEIIGIVTSPTGAVIRDILHRIADRFPRRMLLWPVAVQGQDAAGQIADAIHGFNRLEPSGDVPRPDVLIVARGGGSLEDLWAFNEEIVVRAAAASSIPLISAVGHETDTTLIDFAADVRAPTPTAAAEMAVPVRSELAAGVAALAARADQAVNRTLAEGRSRIEGLARGLPRADRLLDDARQRLDDRAERLAASLGTWIERRRRQLAELAGRLQPPSARLAAASGRLTAESRALDAAIATRLRDAEVRLTQAAGLLESNSFQRVLERGFVLVRDEHGRPLTSAGQLTPGLIIGLDFHDGHVPATVDDPEVPPKPARAAAPARKGRRQPRDDDQGDLF